MARRMRISRAGLDLIKRFEGYREHSVAIGGGEYMIGYGHTRSAREGLRISEENADAILREYDLPPVEKAVAEHVHAPLAQNEFDALVCLAFNIGIEAFLGSEVLALVNSGEKLRAAEAFSAWRKAQIEGRTLLVDALVRRRGAERALFLEDAFDLPESPSPVIRPVFDGASAVLAPRETVQRVETQSGEARIAIIEEADPSDESDTGDTSTEAAARAVSERLSRILGEDDTPEAEPAGSADPRGDETGADDGPSVDEITRAVSELAGDEDTRADDAETRADDDLPFAPAPEEAQLRQGPRRVATTFIDDLDAGDADAVAPPPAAAEPSGWFSILLFALAAFSGALISAWGLEHVGTIVGNDAPPADAWDVYAGPFAIVLGALIFLIMLYYLIRALASRGQGSEAG